MSMSCGKWGGMLCQEWGMICCWMSLMGFERNYYSSSVHVEVNYVDGALSAIQCKNG